MGIIEAITAVGAILSAIFGIYKLISYQVATTPEAKKESIDKSVQTEEDAFKQSGRPQP